MNQRISVIVPVYNVADYLPQCLDSILSQDHEDLEVILIDDGSTDDSGRICDRYAAADPRVRVIHQENAGAAAAKNAGLRVATGEYLSFVDSDDYLEPKVYGYMLSVLGRCGADAAQFGFRNVYRTRREEHPSAPGRQVVSGKDFLIRFNHDWTCALLWNKLYRRGLFDGIFFEEGHKIDDEYFTYQGFLNAGKVVCDERIVYNYRRRASSVMCSPQAAAQRVMDRIDALTKRRQRVIRRFPELRRDFDVPYLDALSYMSQYPDNSEQSLRLLKSLLWDYLKTPGNTLPPRHLWRDLLRLYITPVRRLRKACEEAKAPVDTGDYYP